MNTDKLTTIDDDALDDVAGGSIGEFIDKLIDASIKLGKSNFDSAVDHAATRKGNFDTYLSDVRKALLGS